MLNKVDFVWEAQRGGPRRKRKATVAVPPKANPVELLGPNIRQRTEYGTTPGLSLLGGVADLPFVNMGMNTAVMQAAAAAAAAATPHWAMMGYGAFQASPGSASVTGGPHGVFPNAMLFPMAQPQMPWAMAAMTRFGGAMPPSTATPATPTDAIPVEPATPSAGTSGTRKTEGYPHGGATADSATPVASAAVDPVEAPPEAATTAAATLNSPVQLKTPAQALINLTEEPPPQAPEATATGLTTDSGGVQTTEATSAGTDEHATAELRPIEAAETTSAGTDTTIHLAQTPAEASVTASEVPKDSPQDTSTWDAPQDLPKVEEEDEPQTSSKW